MTTLDAFGRPLRDLRISVTDRCNFRCTYCMPREVFGPDFQFLAREDLLSYEEITRLSRIFISHGVEKLRITGGEPLVRKNLHELIAMLAPLPGLKDLTLTTNGVLLARQAKKLAEAGLQRITVSLDSLDDDTFKSMNDSGIGVGIVLDGIEAAKAAGLAPIKVNAVVKRGVNDDGIIELARYFRGTGHILRFIEFMDVGTTNGWKLDNVVTAAEIAERINAVYPIEPVDANYTGEVARRWRYLDGQGEIGIITSISQPFCGDCTRARLSPEGELFTCLFGSHGTDFRTPLRDGSTDEQVSDLVRRTWNIRRDRYSEIRAENTIPLERVEMSRIGG